MQERAPQLRPMGLLEIIDQTFRLYRANFWLFCGIAAFVYLPLGLVQQSAALIPTLAGRISDMLRLVVPALIIMVVLLVGSMLATGALTKAVSNRYMGEPASVGDAYGYVARRIIPFGLTLLIAYMLIAVGFVFLIVPGIIFLFWIVPFISQVFIIEDRRYGSAIARSRFLVGQGTWAEWLLLGIMTGILMQLIQAVVLWPVTAAVAAAKASAPATWIALGIASGIALTIASPIGLVASILLYYDSRIRKEAFDLEVLARELGKELPAPPAPAQAQGPRRSPSPPAEPSPPSAPQSCAPPESLEASP